MTPDQHRRQHEAVLASELRSHHPDVYARHPLARAVPPGTPSTGAIAQSIREIGEMLIVADAQPEFRDWLADLERLSDVLGEYHAQLRALIAAEYSDAMGAIG